MCDPRVRLPPCSGHEVTLRGRWTFSGRGIEWKTRVLTRVGSPTSGLYSSLVGSTRVPHARLSWDNRTLVSFTKNGTRVLGCQKATTKGSRSHSELPGQSGASHRIPRSRLVHPREQASHPRDRGPSAQVHTLKLRAGERR